MKIAASDFLNTRPLIYALERSGERLILESPFQCANSLENGEVDFALIPSVEYSRIDGLTIVPGISISSFGPVKSVVLFLKKPLSKVKKIAVDERSRTAVTLLRILTREVFRIEPLFVTSSPSLEAMLDHSDAALLIGDQALKEYNIFQGEKIDLGEAWFSLTKLPFVYAFWAGKNINVESNTFIKFIQAREEGLKSCSTIVQMVKQDGLSQAFILDYLTHNINFGWSRTHEEGLRLFYELAYTCGLIEKIPTLRFYGAREYSSTATIS